MGVGCQQVCGGGRSGHAQEGGEGNGAAVASKDAGGGGGGLGGGGLEGKGVRRVQTSEALARPSEGRGLEEESAHLCRSVP